MLVYKTVTNYTYNAANQLTSGGATYDNNGNMTSDGTNSYTWDRANRLLTWDNGVAAALTNHAYDGEGRRVSQAVGTTSPEITKYLLDIQPGLAVVLSQTEGSDVTRFIHAPRGIHARQDATNDWHWTVQDGLGTVRVETDNSVAVEGSQNLDPFGNLIDLNGTIGTPYGFTGELMDGSGLLDLRARRYNAGMGTFASIDPFEGMRNRAMSLNGYSWVEGNVPNAIDPSGMIGELERQIILRDADTWLQTARRINVQSITNMSDEAFALMIAAKFVGEDATCYNDDPDISVGCLKDVASSAGRGPLGGAIEQRYGEISYGAANIPLRQAHIALDFWKMITNCGCTDLNFADFHTDTYRSLELSNQWYYQTFYPNILDDTIASELNQGMDVGSAPPLDAFLLGQDKGWFEWLSVTMLQSAYRAQTYKDRNDITFWVMPRVGPISAYIIALGQVGYNEKDQILYDLLRWKYKGFAYSWVDSMSKLKQDAGLLAGIPWLASTTWLAWTDEENSILSHLDP